MNKAQKLLQPIVPQPDDAKNEYSRGINFGVRLAFNALALYDDITLADVPKVEWVYVAANEHSSELWTHNLWVVYGSLDGRGVLSNYGVRHGEATPHYWTTANQARRYVEIRIHLADLERKLFAELAGGK